MLRKKKSTTGCLANVCLCLQNQSHVWNQLETLTFESLNQPAGKKQLTPTYQKVTLRYFLVFKKQYVDRALRLDKRNYEYH